MARGHRTTPEERQSILITYEANQSIRETATKLGFSTETVHRIIHGTVRDRKKPMPLPIQPAEVPAASPEAVAIAQVFTSPPNDPEGVEARLRNIAWYLAEPVAGHIQSVHANLIAAKDAGTAKALAQQLYSLSLSWGILVDKARLLNDRSTSIIAKQRELEALPPGMTRDMLLEVLRIRIHTVAGAHSGLLPEVAVGG